VYPRDRADSRRGRKAVITLTAPCSTSARWDHYDWGGIRQLCPRSARSPAGIRGKTRCPHTRPPSSAGTATASWGDGPEGWAPYHEPGCPVLTGVVDGGAAGRRAAAAASEATGETVVHGSWLKGAREHIRDIDPGGGPAAPRAAPVIKRTVGQPGTLDECPHLKLGEPAYMVAHRPGVILCTACWIAESQRMTSSRE
jgi:hypothetical protein